MTSLLLHGRGRRTNYISLNGFCGQNCGWCARITRDRESKYLGLWKRTELDHSYKEDQRVRANRLLLDRVKRVLLLYVHGAVDFCKISDFVLAIYLRRPLRIYKLSTNEQLRDHAYFGRKQ